MKETKRIPFRDSAGWIDLAVAACEYASIDYGSIEAITTWDQKFIDYDNFRNNAVFRTGKQSILKIYGTDADRHFNVERVVLQTLSEQKTVPAPRFIAASERTPDLPPFLIMSEVPGATVQHTWDNLSRPEQLAVAREIGGISAEIFRQPQDRLGAVEAQFGGREMYITEMKTERIEDIEATETLSQRQKDELLTWLLGEARDLIEVPPKLTHSDLSHAHIYLARKNGSVKVSAFIDWAEAMLGSPEWDTTFHWFWTFSRDRDAMRECLNTLYADTPLPERFARRCLAAHFYSFSMRELWPEFAAAARHSDSILRAMTAFYFPPEVFGAPD